MRVIKDIQVVDCVIPDVRITAVYDEELKKMLHDSLDVMGQVVEHLL